MDNNILPEILNIVLCNLTSYRRSGLCTVSKQWAILLTKMADDISLPTDRLLINGEYHTFVRRLYHGSFVLTLNDIYMLRILQRIPKIEKAIDCCRMRIHRNSLFLTSSYDSIKNLEYSSNIDAIHHLFYNHACPIYNISTNMHVRMKNVCPFICYQIALRHPCAINDIRTYFDIVDTFGLDEAREINWRALLKISIKSKLANKKIVNHLRAMVARHQS